MGNTGLLRREAEMTLLQPQLGETRRQELKDSPFWHSSLFKFQLVKEGEDFLLKKGTSKDSQGFGPYQNKPFRGPHNKKRDSYRKRPYGGNSSQSSNQSFSSGRGKPNFRGSRGRFDHSRVHQDLPDSRGMGVVDRPIGCLPSHPHPSTLTEIPKVLPQVLQFTSLPFGLATAPQVFTMIVKEVKLMVLSRGLRLYQYLDDWLIRFKSQEEAQVNTQAVVDLTQSLGWIINQEKSELNLLRCFRLWATNTI